MDDLISRKRALEEMTFSGGIEQDGVLYVPLRDVNNHLKSLPSEAYLQTIATERYEDLCKYFGSQADFILTDRQEFKRWLERVKWHVKKVDELTRRSEDEWCTDCPAYDHEKHYCPRFRKVIRRTVQEIQEERIPEHSAWFRISETLVDESKGDITAEQAVEKIRDYLKRMEKPEQKKDEWIPCSKRLPENDEYVLATTAWEDVTMAERVDDTYWYIHEGYTNATIDDVVAWMPKPEPYGGEQE